MEMIMTIVTKIGKDKSKNNDETQMKKKMATKTLGTDRTIKHDAVVWILIYDDTTNVLKYKYKYRRKENYSITSKFCVFFYNFWLINYYYNIF